MKRSDTKRQVKRRRKNKDSNPTGILNSRVTPVETHTFLRGNY